MSTIYKIYNLLKYYKKHFIILVIISFIGFLLSYIQPLMIKYLIDNILMKSQIKYLIIFIGLFLFINVIQIIITVIAQYKNISMGLQIAEDKKNEIFRKALRLRLHDIIKIDIGDWLFRINDDAMALTSIVGRIIYAMINSIISLLLVYVFLFYLSWKIAILSLLLLPVFAILAFYYNKLITDKTNLLYKRYSKVTEFLREYLSTLLSIRKQVCETVADNKHKNHTRELISISTDLRKTGVNASMFLNLFNIGAQAIVISMGGYYVYRGEMTIGGLVALFSYIVKIFDPVQKFVDNYLELKQNIVSLDRVNELLSKEEERDNNIMLPAIKRGIVNFKNVNFMFDDESKILTDANCVFKPNKINVIMGKSGSGKSTILNLLLLIKDLNKGKVCIDDYNICDYSPKSIREAISIVDQEVSLFNDSIHFNLTMGKLIKEEDIINACKLVGLWDFIKSKEDGLNYIVGTNGAYLSGGQKKRIAIARTILRKSKILLLDEPTAHLDVASKDSLLNLLKNIKNEMTIIFTTHDYETINDLKEFAEYFYIGNGNLASFKIDDIDNIYKTMGNND